MSGSAYAYVVYGVPKEKLWTKHLEKKTKTKYDPDTGIPYQDYYFLEYYESFGKRYDDIEDFFVDNFGKEYLDGMYAGEFTAEQGVVGIVVAYAKDNGYSEDKKQMEIPQDKTIELKLDEILDRMGYRGERSYHLRCNYNY